MLNASALFTTGCMPKAVMKFGMADNLDCERALKMSEDFLTGPGDKNEKPRFIEDLQGFLNLHSELKMSTRHLG